MSYIVIKAFSDLNDISQNSPNGHFYQVGDVYPREGFEVEDERIHELSTYANRAGDIFIKETIEKEHKPPKQSKKKVESAGEKKDGSDVK